MMWYKFNPKTIKYTYKQIITLLPREIVDSGFVKSNDRIYQIPITEVKLRL